MSRLPVQDSQFDLVSVAGALPYIDIDPLAAELRQVCKSFSKILVYDFRVDLEEILNLLKLPVSRTKSTYNHSLNLAKVEGIETIKIEARMASFRSSAAEVVNLLLASEVRFQTIADHFDVRDPTETLVSLVKTKASHFDLNATTCSALHKMI